MGRQSRLRGLSPALAVAVMLVLSGCGSNSPDVPAGSDDHVVIDPVAFDPAPAATSVLTTLLSWNPAAQSGPLDIPVDAADRLLAGGLRDQATHPRTASGVLAKPASSTPTPPVGPPPVMSCAPSPTPPPAKQPDTSPSAYPATEQNCPTTPPHG